MYMYIEIHIPYITYHTHYMICDLQYTYALSPNSQWPSLPHIQWWKLLQVDICHLEHLSRQLAPDLGELVVPGREAPWKDRHKAAVQHPKHLGLIQPFDMDLGYKGGR